MKAYKILTLLGMLGASVTGCSDIDPVISDKEVIILNQSQPFACNTDNYAFYRIPKLLFTDSRFQTLSTDAKLLYGMLIDRMELSLKNGWIDEQGRIYLYFTIGEIQGRFRCASGKAVRLRAELDSAKGIGLIESVRQGMGKPNIIYVKNFATE